MTEPEATAAIRERPDHATRCPQCGTVQTALLARVAELEAENERLRDLVVEFRKRDASQDRIRNRLTAERDAAVARVQRVEALCEQARAEHQAHDIAPYVFVDELTAALAGPDGETP